jgi:pimeloyl-ACP methyl ester carboxylesterase
MAGEELTRLASEYPSRVAGLVYLDAAADPADLPATNPEYQELFRKLPAAMRNPPSPETRSFQAYRDSQMRRGDPPFPESELRNIYETNPDGSIGKLKTTQAIHDAIGAGALKRDYSRIRVPILAFFSAPCKYSWQGEDYACIQHADAKPAYEPKNDEERSAVKAYETATVAYLDRWKNNLRTAHGRVRIVDLPNAHHYIFLSNERDVTSEMRQFMLMLR